MTDTFIVDDGGGFVVGKAQTTPEDESVGFMRSARGRARRSGTRRRPRPSRRWCPASTRARRCSTACSSAGPPDRGDRDGRPGGLPQVRARDPDLPRLLVRRPAARGHALPQPADRPARADEGRAGPDRRARPGGAPAARGGRAPGGRRSCTRPAWRGSWSRCCSPTATPSTRSASGRSCARALAGQRRACRSTSSSELYPLRRDLPRLNSTLIEAYAAEPSRGMLQKVRDVTREHDAGFELRVMAAHGGTISIEAKELARTLVSGPIGGVVGGQALAERDGPVATSLCTDIGGTSFDIALITDGRFEITPDPGHRPLRAQHPAGEDRLDRRRHRLVRARRTPTRTGPSSGRTRRARASASAGRRAGSTPCRSPT